MASSLCAVRFGLQFQFKSPMFPAFLKVIEKSRNLIDNWLFFSIFCLHEFFFVMLIIDYRTFIPFFLLGVCTDKCSFWVHQWLTHWSSHPSLLCWTAETDVMFYSCITSFFRSWYRLLSEVCRYFGPNYSINHPIAHSLLFHSPHIENCMHTLTFSPLISSHPYFPDICHIRKKSNSIDNSCHINAHCYWIRCRKSSPLPLSFLSFLFPQSPRPHSVFPRLLAHELLIIFKIVFYHGLLRTGYFAFRYLLFSRMSSINFKRRVRVLTSLYVTYNLN